MANVRDLKTKLALGAVGISLLTSACSGVRGELDESGQVQDSGPVELAFEGDVDAGDLEGTEVNFAFRAPDLYTGNMIEGAQLFAEAPLIMVFAVPSCDVCHVEAPKIAAAAEIHPDINYVIIHSFGTTDDYLEFSDEAGLFQENVVQLIDTEGILWERFGVVSQPSSVLVDVDGVITSSRGALGDDGLARAAAQVTKTPVLEHDAFDLDRGSSEDTATDPAAEEPAAEEPAADEPATDEPASNEPAEEPVTEDPATDPAAEDPVAE